MKRKSKELKRIARDILNNRYTVPMGAFVTASLIPTVIEIPFSLSMGDYPTPTQLIISFLANFLIMLIFQVLSVGVIHLHLNMTRNTSYRLSNVFDPFRSGVERFFGAIFLLDLLSVLACLPVIGGAFYFYYNEISSVTILVFVLSGLISLLLSVFLTLNYQFVSFFLLDYPQMKIIGAFRECRLLMKHNKMRLLYILLSFLGYSLLILCSLGIASLWVSPYMTQTLVVFYLDCTGELDRIPIRNDAADTAEVHNSIY